MESGLGNYVPAAADSTTVMSLPTEAGQRHQLTFMFLNLNCIIIFEGVLFLVFITDHWKSQA